MGKAYLVEPSMQYRESYLAFYREWKESQEPIVPWVVDKDPSDLAAYLQYLEVEKSGENLQPGWVANSTYWLVDEQEQVVGAVNIRHSLNEKLLNTGGHIGYGVVPSQRRKGYATRILAQSLQKTRELGLTRVMVACDEGNIGSEKTIAKNGGVFESAFIEEDGNVVRRFWIEL
ncbi:GNAT family N-acetyltransferase [Brevibacillus centrosporus]|jgi:predicted acetyltransferase|uniref:Predicted acetyltransferase n=1 Tax=Brevibacillus centrosporus TaxID=54910 RepID=A0A1I3LR78_9BACL|nr:GNAT family N-acetyltransferase [Brevibacillus centrosporus]MED4906860.1 GNAT family N-acetyltransferase [Brevibacillus centrosporus]SFI87050.1 Predicted acetyltransferase [Brevibacillus centrosporus]